MKKIVYFIIVSLISGCAVHPQLKTGIAFPDMLSPIYYLDTFQIRDPVVIYINSVPYITNKTILKDTLDDKPLEERKGVIQYLDMDLTVNKTWDYIQLYKIPRRELRKSYYSLQYENERIFIEDNLIFVDSLQGAAVYRFDLQPENFLLTLITKKDSTITTHGGGPGLLANDVIIGVDYSNDYMFALAPLFSRKNKKILMQRERARCLEKPSETSDY